MSTKKANHDLFLTHFSIKFSGSQTFLKNFEPLFLEKYQRFYKLTIICQNQNSRTKLDQFKL
jgi:hypothetical protein